ncbi:MAG: hypothetical protein ACM359_21615 [Bacillota bacterium]
MFRKILTSVVVAGISMAAMTLAGCSLDPGTGVAQGDQPSHFWDRPTGSDF